MKRDLVPRKGPYTADVWSHIAGPLSLTCVVLAAAACTVGPDFVRPKVSLNASWREHGDPRLAADAPADPAWWRSFNDRTLDRLIELAYHQNLSLQIAGLRILESRAQLGIAVGNQYPENPGPIASASAVGLTEDAAARVGLDRNYREYQVGFDAIWELDIWGRYRRGVRAANATYFATVADYDDALVSLSAEVARTYVLIRTFEALVAQARQNAALQEEGLQIAESRFRNGATSELDVAQAATLLESTRVTIPVLQISLQQAQNALSTLLGRPTGYVQSLLTEPGGIPAPPARVAVGVPAEMLRRRPDIRGAELRALAQCERIGVAKAELYPSFVLSGSIGTQVVSDGGIFGPGSLAYKAGGSLFWPILNYPRILNNMRVEDARFQQSLVEYVNVVLTAAQEVEDGMTGFLRQQDAAVFAQNAATAAELAVKLAFVQYREGAVDYQRVLDTQRVLLETQNRLVNVRASAATNLIALYKALGGGWEVRRGAPVVTESARRDMQHRTNWGFFFPKPREPGPQTVNGSPGRR